MIRAVGAFQSKAHRFIRTTERGRTAVDIRVRTIRAEIQTDCGRTPCGCDPASRSVFHLQREPVAVSENTVQ